MAKDKSTKKEKTAAKVSLPPSGFKVVWREIKKDKVAMGALIIIIAVLLFTFVGSLFLNKSQVTEVNIADVKQVTSLVLMMVGEISCNY